MSHIQFSDYELKTLLDDKRNCVKFQKGVKHISLHPFYLNNVAAGIAENLNKLVSKYDKSLNGIILAYKKPRLQQCNGIVHNDKGSIFVDVEAEFYIFCPQENSCVKAIVNKTGQDHVGCLIHKAFNMSVPRPRNETDWKGKFVKTGDEILVKITYVDMYYIIPYIKGEIVEILMKFVKSEIDNDNEISTNDHNPKTIKKKSKSNKNKSFIDSNKVEEDAVVKVQLKIDPEKENNKKARKSKIHSIIPEMTPHISDNPNSEKKNGTDLTQFTVGKIKSKNRRNTISEIIPPGNGSLENTIITINNNFKSKNNKSKDNIEVDASPISSKLKKREIYNVKLDETNELSEQLIKKIKIERNVSPIPDRSKLENPDTYSGKKVKSPKKIKNDSLSKISKHVERKENEKNDETNEVREKLIKKIKTERNASPIPDSSKIENSDMNSAKKVKSPKKTNNDSLSKISKNVERKENKKNDETNEVWEKLIKKIKTERNASPIPDSSKIENSDMNSAKKVKSPKKTNNDSLNKISKNMETTLNGINESKIIKSPATQDDNKLSKKIKHRRQTVSELLPTETLTKEEKKKRKKHNRSLDDTDIVLQKPAIDFTDGSPKKSKKSKKQKSTTSEVENDIQTLKNKLIQSVLNECGLNKQDSNLEQSNSQTSTSKKRKKKHSIETSEINLNNSELTPQKHETLDGRENGLKKPKSKRKKMNSSSDKYSSLQLDTPNYVDYVPSNEVSTFHDSISPIKMKDRPNLSSPETKKYTSPVGSERRKSKTKKSPAKPSGLLSDFHTDLITKYLNK